MKIAIIGYSGCGKSTLAEFFSKKYNLPLLYLDKIHHLAGWKEQKPEIEQQKVKNFLDNNENWVIDGNYFKLSFERRMNEADRIIFMNFNCFNCLFRVIKRYLKYKGKNRSSMTDGCEEKIDFEFVSWILHYGRTKEKKKKHANVINTYKSKTVIIRNQKQLDKFYEGQMLYEKI